VVQSFSFYFRCRIMGFDDQVHVEERFEEVLVSDCCGAEVVYDDICSECLKHCETVVVMHEVD